MAKFFDDNELSVYRGLRTPSGRSEPVCGIHTGGAPRAHIPKVAKTYKSLNIM